MKAKGSYDFCSFFASTGTEGKASMERRWGKHTRKKEAVSIFLPMLLVCVGRDSMGRRWSEHGRIGKTVLVFVSLIHCHELSIKDELRKLFINMLLFNN